MLTLPVHAPSKYRRRMVFIAEDNPSYLSEASILPLEDQASLRGLSSPSEVQCWTRSKIAEYESYTRALRRIHNGDPHAHLLCCGRMEADDLEATSRLLDVAIDHPQHTRLLDESTQLS